MVALSKRDKSRVYYHAGYGCRAGIDAGDLAEVEQACDTVPDQYTRERIKEHLDFCDKYEKGSRLGNGASFTTREIYSGDLNRAIVRENSKDTRTWKEEYNNQVRELCQLMWIPNYREPGMERYRYSRAAGAFINAIPGVADTAVSSRRLEFSQLGGGFGF